MSKETLEIILNELEEEVYCEFQFAKHLKRKFRADYFIPISGKGILIEYNGLSYRNANKNGHQSSTGMIKDMEKQNLALELGYVCLNYNFTLLKDSQKVKDQIIKVINLYKSLNHVILKV
jgi:hypothetical protein